MSVPDAGPPGALVDLAVEAEAAGWDGFFLWDHLQLFRVARFELHDPWVVLGAVAHATSRIRLGTLVTPVPRRRPWKLAKEVVTLDHLSGGRAVLGVGLGFPAEHEFGDFGEPTGDRERADVLDEGLALLDRLLRGGEVRHRGTHFTVDADVYPGALQQPRPPIWVAAMWPNRRPFRRAARWDGIVPMFADEPFRPEQVADVVGACGPVAPGFDVVLGRHWDCTPADYDGSGVTWLLDSTWPEDGWYADLRRRVVAGPGSR